MDAHPLKGSARWLILLGLSGAAGAPAGLIHQGISREAGRDIVLIGAVLGLATAFATAITPKTWTAVLLAPTFALLGMCASTAFYFFPQEPEMALLFVVHFRRFT